MTFFRPEISKWTLAACEAEDLTLVPLCRFCRRWVAVVWSRVPTELKDDTIAEAVSRGAFRCRRCKAVSGTLTVTGPTPYGPKTVWSTDGPKDT